jgi:hypothetical protein
MNGYVRDIGGRFSTISGVWWSAKTSRPLSSQNSRLARLVLIPTKLEREFHNASNLIA